MTREEYIDFANALKNNYTIDFDKLPEFCDMAISALSEELSEDGTLTVHVSDGSKVKRVFVMGDNIFGGLYYPDSAENKGEWIPVSERLPKEGETVLVCYRTQGGIAQSVCEWFDMPNRGIVWSTLSERKPIAWQPLPEPYKKGE